MNVTLVTRPIFAKQHGVSKAAVQKWEARGAVVIIDGKVHVEATDRLLAHAGLGRFSDRPRKPPAPPAPAPEPEALCDATETEPDLAPAALLLVHYFNRICAHPALCAWECGAGIDVAKKVDELFRPIAMGVATDLLNEIGFIPPTGSETWDDAPIWDVERMASIDWTAVEAEQ